MYYFMLPVILDFMVTIAGNIELQANALSLGDSMSNVVFPVLEAQPEIAAVGDAWIKLPEGILTVAIPSTEEGMPPNINHANEPRLTYLATISTK